MNAFRNIGHGRLGDHVMTNDEIARVAPSVFATTRHESRTDRYTYIPTGEIVDGMRAHGFEPTYAKQGNSRVEGKSDFTKHLVRFRHTGSVAARGPRIGNVYPEVVLVNSHDGTSQYVLNAGLWRLVCLNGMMVCDSQFAGVKVPHKGDILNKVIEGSFEVIQESQLALERAESWSGVTLNSDEQMALATSVHTVRFADHEGNVETPIRPLQLLGVRRGEDRAADLWTVSNRIQENAVRGGLSAMGHDALNRPRMTTTREVKGIDGDVKLNKAIWQLSEMMAAFKGA
jgi:hypothetical protein